MNVLHDVLQNPNNIMTMPEPMILNREKVGQALVKALNTAIRKQGYNEDGWFEYMMDEDDDGDLHWSVDLTIKVLHRMGYGCTTLRRSNNGMDDDVFNEKWSAFFNSAHQQMIEMKLV